MKHIKVLPQLLVDKIAAGEVIERPASVVKELVENAIDAGATEIKVELEEGGKKLIRVTDNGEGILAEDLPLVFVRHATSKIKEDADLYRIKTLGFRGEALASIAAVSQVRLVTNPTSAATAWCVTAQNGRAEKPVPVAGEKGTTVEVRHLFFNLPARAKFLKSTSIELFHITDVVTRIALAYPEIRFDLIHQVTPEKRESIINLPPTSNLLDRISYLFGKDLADNLIKAESPVSAQGEVLAYLSTPVITKPTMRHQYFYLNQRFIRDRLLTRAVIQAYSDFIPSQRFPVIFWFMKLPPDEFDVNVHPTKIEVKFRNTWAIHELVIKTIHQALTTHRPAGIPPVPTQSVGTPTTPLSERERVLQAMMDFFTTHPQPVSNLSPAPQTPPFGTPAVHPPAEKNTLISPKVLSRSAQIFTTNRSYFQIHNSYIIEEVPDGLVIIDQHALHERILYNRLKREFLTQSIYRQQLLVPITVELEPKQMTLLGTVRPYLEQLGFQIDEFGRNTIRLLAIPVVIDSSDQAELIKTIMDNFAEGVKESDAKTIIENLLRLIACKSAIKAGDRLTDEEITSLLAQREETDYHLTCPHGRPATFKITLTELTKRFQR